MPALRLILENDDKKQPDIEMRRASLTRQRLAVVFLFGLLLLFSPIVRLADTGANWQGVPVLYLYLFLVWTGLIVAMAWILSDRNN